MSNNIICDLFFRLAAKFMKLLIVVGDFPTHENDPNYSYHLNQVNALMEQGVEVEILILRSFLWSLPLIGNKRWLSPNFTSRNDTHAKIHDFKVITPPGRFDLLSWAQLAGKQSAKAVKTLQGNFDAAIIHGEVLGYALIDHFRKANIPTVLVLHGVSDSFSATNYRGKQVLYKAIEMADKVVSVGYGLDLPGWIKGVTDIIPNGVSLQPSSSPILRQSTPTVLSVSNLKKTKGVQDNIRALKVLNDKGIEINYWIIGDGKNRQHLENLVKELGLCNHVKFLGMVERDKITHYLESADIFSLASFPETFGIAHFEAASKKKPIVLAKDSGPAQFFVDKESALFVEYGDFQAIAHSWYEILHNRLTAKSLGENAFEVSRRFTWDNNARELIRLVEGLRLEKEYEQRKISVGWFFVQREHYTIEAVREMRNRFGFNVNPFYQNFFSSISLFKSILKHDFQVVLVEGWANPYSVGSMALLHLTKTPFYVVGDTFVQVAKLGRIKSSIKFLVMNYIVRKAEALFPGGTPQSRYFASLFKKHSPQITIAKVSSDLSEFKTLQGNIEVKNTFRSKHGILQDDILVLYVGRLEVIKGPETLIKAFELSSVTVPNLKLIIIGAGSLKSGLEAKYAKNLKIHFLSSLFGSEVAQAMVSSDIFVIPSKVDQWGIVVNEALASQLPVIASDKVGSVEDLIEPYNAGITFKSGDYEDLSEKITLLALDEKLRYKLASNGPKAVSNWDLKDRINIIGNELQRLLYKNS